MSYNLVLYVEATVIFLVGCLLHFTYAWSGRNKFVAIFSAVNESTWEHIKLALSGIFLCMLVDVWFLGDNPNYWLARSILFVAPIVVIPLIFLYLYIFYEACDFVRRYYLFCDCFSSECGSFCDDYADGTDW